MAAPEETVPVRAKCCLFIDNNEKNLPEAFGFVCKNEQINIPPNTVFVDHLRIGDYAIATKLSPDSDDLVVRLVLERKTKDDLINSIGSTRWSNQLANLLRYREEFPDTVIGYIIESDQPESDSFYDHMASALIDLNIHVIRTNSTYATVKYLLGRVKSLGDSASLPELITRKIAAYKEFQGKKYDISSETFLVELLKIIPKITPQCAEAIASRYRSVFDFLARCTPNDLVGTAYTTTKGTQAKIGQKRAQTIVDMVWSIDGPHRPEVQRLLHKRTERKREAEQLLKQHKDHKRTDTETPSKSSKSKRSKHS